jgi:hypothetical protein
MKLLRIFKRVLNEVWLIPTIILGFFLLVETAHMVEHSHCRNATEQSSTKEGE